MVFVSFCKPMLSNAPPPDAIKQHSHAVPLYKRTHYTFIVFFQNIVKLLRNFLGLIGKPNKKENYISRLKQQSS